MANNKKDKGKKEQKPQRSCIFCQGYGMTAQHFWPDWMGRDESMPTYRKKEGPTSKSYSQLLNRMTILHSERTILVDGPQVKQRQGPFSSRKLLIVCGKCNNGWMSDIEVKSKPVVKSLISQQEVILSDSDQKKLAVWLTLMTIVAEFTDLPMKVIPGNERKAFMDTKESPATWVIWLGRTDSDVWQQRYHHVATGVANPADLPLADSTKANIQISIFGLGGIVAFISSTSDPKFQSLITNLSPAGMVKLCPPTGSPINWDSMRIITSEEIFAMSEVFRKYIG